MITNVVMGICECRKATFDNLVRGIWQPRDGVFVFAIHNVLPYPPYPMCMPYTNLVGCVMKPNRCSVRCTIQPNRCSVGVVHSLWITCG